MNDFSSTHYTTLWLPEIDSEACNGCGICVKKRCKFDALAIEDKIVKLSPDNCIGCGLCVTTCPTNAIMLQQRSPLPVVPENAVKRSLMMANEKGRLKAFVSVTKESRLAYYLAKASLIFQK